MTRIMNAFEIIWSVLSEKKYLKKFLFSLLIIGILAAFLMVIISWNGLIYDKQIIISPDLTFDGIIFWLLFSILASVAITLYLFKTDKMKAAGIIEGGSTLFGAFLGMFSSACAICQPLLFTLIGIPFSFAFLPLKGAEFKLLSLFLISGSIYLLTDSINKGEYCEPHLKQKVKSAHTQSIGK